MEYEGKKLLIKALKHYTEEADESNIKDLLIDILHISDAGISENDRKNFVSTARRAFDNYLEERKDAEMGQIAEIPTEELPLHVHDNFKFKSGHDYFLERMKEV